VGNAVQPCVLRRLNDHGSTSEATLSLATAKAEMNEKTARRYRRFGKVPSKVKDEGTWRTRPMRSWMPWPPLQGERDRP